MSETTSTTQEHQTPLTEEKKKKSTNSFFRRISGSKSTSGTPRSPQVSGTRSGSTSQASATPAAQAPAPRPAPAPAAQAAPQLPAGWQAVLDASGRTYYWNTANREVTWDFPTAAAILETQETVQLPRFEKGKVSLANFKVKSTLGTGSFGRVKLAQDHASKRHLALKILRKSEIIRTKQVHHIKNEKAILDGLSHPFIVNLLGYFQDPYNLYLVLEYVPGGELFTLLRRRKRFNNDVSVFYAAQIVLAFAHLHSRDVVYRDLKPENLLIGRDGYLKITDFGFAKEVPDDKRTYTICGTPEYLAPEIIQSRGHSCACDWWALGILIYEMLCGYPPFESDSPYGIYRRVLAGNIIYPRPVNDDAKDLLIKLLHPKPAYRLGSLKDGPRDIMSHPWFRELNWEKLESKLLTPPYLPTIASEHDTSNFTAYSEDEQQGERVDEDIFSDFG